MGALRAFAAALAFIAAVLSFTAQGRESERWRGLASEAADRFGLPVEWVMRVIEAESAGRTTLGGRPITSHAGAMGLMQIMPATWASLRAQYGLGPDPHDPRDNIVAGTAYLRAMYDRFGYPGLFGAYNAGPGRYGEFVADGRPLPLETHAYMAKIAGVGAAGARARRAVRGPAMVARSATPAAIFFARQGGLAVADDVRAAPAARSRPAPEERTTLPADDLFAVRRDKLGREP